MKIMKDRLMLVKSQITGKWYIAVTDNRKKPSDPDRALASAISMRELTELEITRLVMDNFDLALKARISELVAIMDDGHDLYWSVRKALGKDMDDALDELANTLTKTDMANGIATNQ